MNENFENNGYVRVDNFLDEITVGIVSKYLENKLFRKEWVEDHKDDPAIVSKYYYYADPLVETLLEVYREEVERHTGRELIPTYSYARIYQPGEQLEIHIDRPSCEISTTVSVAYNGDISEIYMSYKGNLSKIKLNPGDAVIYKGCEVYHSRDVLKPDQIVVQFMLHYVDKNGSNTKYRFDNREHLGLPAESRLVAL